MRITGRHWAVALSIAVLVHAGAAVALLWQPPESGAKSVGLGGIEMSLGPAGGAPGGEARLVEEIAEVETEAPVPAASEPPPDRVMAMPPDPALQEATDPVEAGAVELEEQPVESIEQAVAAEPESPQPVEEAAAVEPAQTTAVEAVEQETPLPMRREVAAKPVVAPPLVKPKSRPPAPPLPASMPEPAPEPVKEPAPRMADTAEPPVERLAAIAPPAPGAGGKAGTQASPDAGSADDRTGGGMPGEMADYMAQLQAWLEKHKEYPRRAQARRQEGTALLYFVMDREGRVLEYRIQQSSGHGLLDREVMAMIQRAQPLPKMPDDMRQSQLELVVPVQFFLR